MENILEELDALKRKYNHVCILLYEYLLMYVPENEREKQRKRKRAKKRQIKWTSTSRGNDRIYWLEHLPSSSFYHCCFSIACTCLYFSSTSPCLLCTCDLSLFLPLFSLTLGYNMHRHACAHRRGVHVKGIKWKSRKHVGVYYFESVVIMNGKPTKIAQKSRKRGVAMELFTIPRARARFRFSSNKICMKRKTEKGEARIAT